MTDRPRPFVRTAGLALALLLLAAPASPAAVDVGEKPALQFRSTDGKEIKLSDYKGKLVVIDFWATWCGPCMAQAKHMVELNHKWAPQGLALIGISLDADRARMDAVCKEKGFDWPQYFDGQGWENRLAQQWGVTGIPRTFLIGPDGDVLWVGHPARIDAALADAFEKHPPAKGNTPEAKPAEKSAKP